MSEKKKVDSPKPFKCWFIYRNGEPFCGPYHTKESADSFRAPDEVVKPVVIMPRPQK